ncbi:UNVERIFIED_CONTAM: hypothetical protein PYX00_002406 [Menopon gallinae]|uniref:Uncharacterized protein n=1 Tax=Menopon gallinae TaxID=328185 RepID=A0AAW2IHZ1_9NEOP
MMDSSRVLESRGEILEDEEKLNVTDDNPKSQFLCVSNESGLNDCTKQLQKTDNSIPDDPVFLEETQKGDPTNEDIIPENKSDELIPNSEECSASIQPLDLSLPFLQESKTDNKMLKENQSNIPKTKSEMRSSPDIKQYDVHESNKENVTNASKKIEVTISRPGQKEYYQPCEEFLNDVAKISPDLIKNDCYEIDIIDRTNIENFQTEKSRTYYIVSEATWQIFENSTERIILTNDLNIGQPIQNSEKVNKPKYLIFDQHSLTESLAKICEKKGGRFEYTYLEESKDLISREQARLQVKDCDNQGVSEQEKSETSKSENETRDLKSDHCAEGASCNDDKIGLSESKVHLKNEESCNGVNVSCDNDVADDSKMDVNDADVPETGESVTVATDCERISEQCYENIDESEACPEELSELRKKGKKRRSITVNERVDVVLRKSRRLSRGNEDTGKESDEELEGVSNRRSRSRAASLEKNAAKKIVEKVKGKEDGAKVKAEFKRLGPVQTLRKKLGRSVVEDTSSVNVIQTRSKGGLSTDTGRKHKKEPEKKRKEVPKKSAPVQMRLTRSMRTESDSKTAKMVQKNDNATPGTSKSKKTGKRRKR